MINPAAPDPMYANKMSRVTNAILTANPGRNADDEIAAVNEFLRLNK